MIDLNRTRSELLAEIGALEPAGDVDLTDPCVTDAVARVVVSGRTREELFPLLEVALSERFAAVSRARLIADLLMPLKNALGNAQKHGNGENRAKDLSVELVLARRGVLIAITDEGEGFDAGATLRRFRGGEGYFTHHGSGFRNLDRAASPVTYENGGRTVILCFMPESEGTAGQPSWHATSLATGSRALQQAPGGDTALERIVDPEWIRIHLAAELPEIREGLASVESCRAYPARGGAGDACSIRYVIRLDGRGARPAVTRILTGRLHASGAAAAADFEAATRLRERIGSHRPRIPRPVARLPAEPRLVVYEFNPWMDLWEYLAYRGSREALRRCAGRFGCTLAALHRSPIDLPDGSPRPAEERLRALVAGAARTLDGLPSGPRHVERLRALAEPLARQGIPAGRPPVPIHGALGWDSILHGVDRRFYLYRFESCRRSDAGLDLGGFAADLLCFASRHHYAGTYHTCLDLFLARYALMGGNPMGRDDLRPYTALAVLERLERAGPSWSADAGHLLGALAAL